MAFPGNVNRYVLSGTLPGGERWATGWYGDPTSVGSAQGLADAVDDAGSLGLAALTSIRSMLSPASSITRFQVYTYGAGRSIVDQGDTTLALAGTGSATALPNQCSCVFTLRTAVRSRRGRGRMYIPATGLSISAGGVFVSATIQSAVNGVGAYLDNLNARVVSETGTLSNSVTRVDADLVPDVQRRRVDAMTSARVGYNFV